MCIMASEKNAITRNHPTLAVPNLRIRRNPYDGIVSCKPPASKLKKPKLFIQQPQTSYPQLSLIMSATGTCHCSELDTVHALFRSENQIQAFFNCRHLTGFCSASSRPSHLWQVFLEAGLFNRHCCDSETFAFRLWRNIVLTPSRTFCQWLFRGLGLGRQLLINAELPKFGINRLRQARFFEADNFCPFYPEEPFQIF